MSYKRYDKEHETPEEYQERVSDFYNILPNLEKAETTFVFDLWYEKLELVCKELLIPYIFEHKNEIKPEYIEYLKIVRWKTYEKL